MPYQTPGVYVEEISTLPRSVAEVATAIPAFIGYTGKGPLGAVEVAEISTMLDYEERFGGPKPAAFTVATDGASITAITRDDALSPNPSYFLHEALSLYFKNGGGRCYVISVDRYDNPLDLDRFEAGLAELERHDEPTLIVIPEAVNLSEAEFMSLTQATLGQCHKLQDRFAILDVPRGDVAEFRDQSTGTRALAYGAAYHPYLETSLTYAYYPGTVQITGTGGTRRWTRTLGGILVGFAGPGDAVPMVNTDAGTAEAEPIFSVEGMLLTIDNVAGKDGGQIAAAWDTWAAANPGTGFLITASDAAETEVELTAGSASLTEDVDGDTSLASLASTDTALYNLVKKALAAERVTLPPSAAVAGVYCSVDRDRGVWKAPANVSLAAVIGPSRRITATEQETLNVDPSSGKSINAIRAFTGKGTLVWGARTLAGNDNEWRYVSVRRLFITIEESTKKATAFAVFEPNDAGTWLKVKGMIESYLYGLCAPTRSMSSTSAATSKTHFPGSTT